MSDHPKQFVVYKDAAGEFRWTLFAANAKRIADSAEGYKNKADCKHGARLVAGIASNAPVFNGDTQKWEED